MRIAVLRTQVPFVTGGAERHAAALVGALEARGHAAVEVTVPFKGYPAATLARSTLAAKMIDVTEVEHVRIDLAIGLKFPAWLARHPRKVFWVLHQHRQAYDLWESGHSDLLTDPEGGAARSLVMEEDRRALGEGAAPVFANSQNVAERLRRFVGVTAEPLYHPPPLAGRLQGGAAEGYVFAPGRINPSKRLDLVIEGLAASRPGLRLVVAGVPENPAHLAELKRLAEARGVADRIDWLGAVDDDTLLKGYAGASAVVFAPRDEDYGYIGLEAMLASKPLVTVTDAGGPLEFVRDGEEGLVAEPTPEALGAALARIADRPDEAARMGRAGRARYDGMDISWDTVVDTLVDPDAAPAAPSGRGHAGSAAEAPLTEETAEGAGPDPATTRDAAVAKLTEAVAPPDPPAGLPFASVQDVLAAYSFDTVPRPEGAEALAAESGVAAYFQTHWTRYLTTLAALAGLAPRRILDVGTFPPLIFEALLAARFPGADLLGLWEGPEPSHQHVSARTDAHPDFGVALAAANGERDRWPYEDGSVDLVLCMEILEHLALDPYFFFCEANRVLAPGGHILVTTPNVVSHRGVWKAVNREAPYSFGIFVPTGGVYGRHNREYAPDELPALAGAAGFETVSLDTFDVYDRVVTPEVAELLVARDDRLELRGETIFFLARKAGPPTGAPDRFFHGDPARMSGTLALHGWGDDGRADLALTNTARVPWIQDDGRATELMAEWIDAEGTFRYLTILPGPPARVEPGETVRLGLAISAEGGAEPPGRIRLHLHQEGVGTISGTGRARPLELPCSREAFLRLADPGPDAGADADTDAGTS
ncbi:MAG: glycosyltransferase [Deinococcus-Thermus bacterium]|jgi:glycosyltransferase involved in cell wall biosynthesis/SAM-dependent methyltransferase|nr:glycosyltransferase [Deinococcota bacterium]